MAHKRSAGLSLWMMSNWEMSMPACASAGANTVCGGASRTMVLPACESRLSTGASKRNSPPPCCAHSNSVNMEGGQPPPGNSALSCA